MTLETCTVQAPGSMLLRYEIRRPVQICKKTYVAGLRRLCPSIVSLQRLSGLRQDEITF